MLCSRKRISCSIITRYDVCRLACKECSYTLTLSDIQTAFRMSCVIHFDPMLLILMHWLPPQFFSATSNMQTYPRFAWDVTAQEHLESKSGYNMQFVRRAMGNKQDCKVVGGQHTRKRRNRSFGCFGSKWKQHEFSEMPLKRFNKGEYCNMVQ